NVLEHNDGHEEAEKSVEQATTSKEPLIGGSETSPQTKPIEESNNDTFADDSDDDLFGDANDASQSQSGTVPDGNGDDDDDDLFGSGDTTAANTGTSFADEDDIFYDSDDDDNSAPSSGESLLVLLLVGQASNAQQIEIFPYFVFVRS
ncbi:MAG: hypothetical protein AAGM67_19675, partial [Bacteroidota bacterium]